MGNISEIVNWEPSINQIETSDPLLGGDTGPLNLSAKQLANRTQWLKQAMQGFVGIQNFTVNHTLVVEEMLYNLIVVNADAKTLAITLPDSQADPDNPIPYGLKGLITAINVNKSQVAILCGGTDQFVDGSTDKTAVYLGDGDFIQVIFTQYGWLFKPERGNFDDVGGIEHRYKQLPNTLIAQGQLVNRADYPRLWAYVQTLGASIISDSTWNTVANSKGFYSTGNGTTTFRLPDLRAMFLRSLDLGAGIDTGRPNNNPGAYEADNIKAHTHDFTYIQTDVGIDFGSGATRSSWTAEKNGNGTTASTGGNETTVKNIGLLPLIKV